MVSLRGDFKQLSERMDGMANNTTTAILEFLKGRQ
jgi:hypothetical protein